MLQMLKNGLSPDQMITTRCLKDPVLVSIDVGVGPRGYLETIGIACLDSRFLADSRMDSMTSRLLLLRRRSLPSNQRTRQYLFGIPEHSPLEAVREVLQTVFRQVDQEQGGLRNVLLVGHNIDSDVRYLEDTIGFNVVSIPSIIAVIDTQQLARRVFNFRHNGGNDAVYTLKALMHLFCSYQEDAIDQSKLCVRPLHRERDGLVELLWRERLDLLRQTARCCPRPIPPREAMRAARQPRHSRVDNPDLFEIDTTSDGETEGAMIAMFGDES
jgi:hypothetical protein